MAEFRHFCSRRWRGPSEPLIAREASCLRDRAKESFCLQNGASPDERPMVMVGCGGVRSARGASMANADPQVVLPGGLPVQVKPTYSEPGLPAFSVSDWRRVVARRVDRKRRHRQRRRREHERRRRGPRRRRRRWTMLAQRGGSAAANAAGAMGVSATALAATCVMESNCQNVGGFCCK